MLGITCALATAAICDEQSPGPATASPAPTNAPIVLSDPCGGSQELLKKYLSASPCVFIAGQAGIEATYSGTNVPVVARSANGKAATVVASSHAFGYPGVLLNVGVSPTSQVTIVLPSFSQISSTQAGTAAGTADTEYRYKQLVYVDSRRGILGGILATYEAPTGSPALRAPGPSYEVNPLLNIALNKARTIGENLSFPVTNAPSPDSAAAPRQWSFAPQAVTFWRSPGGTLLAVIAQYGFSNNSLYLTLNAAQLLSRNFQIQGTYGGNDMPVDYANPVEDIGRANGTAHSRSFTIGVSYLIGRSETPPR